MCTSFISNRKKTIVGWNLDIMGFVYRVNPSAKGVYIEIEDATYGWLPLFGATANGEFVGMPTCHPYDSSSDHVEGSISIMQLDIDLLIGNRSFEETKQLVENAKITSNPGCTFMGAISDSEGNMLHIVPGQGWKYYSKPKYKVLTNFSPFKGYSVEHPWQGRDRYETAVGMLEEANDDFDVKEAFDVLKAVSQTVCPTVSSMVYDVTERKVYWCMEQAWDSINEYSFKAVNG